MILSRTTAFRGIVLLVGFAIAGCETTPTPETRPTTDREAAPAVAIDNADIQNLLARASRTSGNEAARLTLAAAEQALANGNSSQARAILGQRATNLTPELGRRTLYLEAELQLAEGNPPGALETLQKPLLLSGELTRRDQIRMGEIRAAAYYEGRSYLASARERIFIHNLLPGEEQASNHEAIYATLMELPASTLMTQAERAITSDIRGWLSLAGLSKRNQNDPLKQLIELNRWKQAWPHHPAASRLPASLQSLSRVVDEQPQSIAFLLPLRGELGPFGRAIRDGLLAAHYAGEARPSVRIYDTTEAPIEALLNRARQDGAELAIGPLDRQRVTDIAALRRLPLPVLALNRTLGGAVHADLYQFGLAPEDEVTQVARQVWREGKRDALVLYAASEWGERNFATFETTWQEMGGNLVDAAAFTNERDYSDLVKALLDVDESEQRAAELRRITGQRFEFTPRRRQDIDFVFLLANPLQARRLNPTLAFFYAEDLPVYATSHVYEYTDSKIEAIDLNGIRFCDIPWKLTDADSLQRRVQDTWSAARDSLAPFYALGVDAWRLYPRLQQLKQIPESKLYGSTGVLQLNEANVVTRELMWARFVDGEAVSTPIVMEVGSRQGI